jgi:hypothetical protein
MIDDENYGMNWKRVRNYRIPVHVMKGVQRKERKNKSSEVVPERE